MKSTSLITAYAVNPYKGSEDGTGWNWVYQLSKTNRIIAITRENNLPHIHKYLEENEVPVAALREGSWLRVTNDRCELCGATGMKLFRAGADPEEIAASDVSDLL